MKKKSSRRRIDVNVDELDRIIEAAMREPLSEADGQTLKTRRACDGGKVSAMAERGESQCRAGTESTTLRNRYAAAIEETGAIGKWA